MTPAEVRWLERIPYEEAWALQKALASARARQEIPDTLLLLEHPHTYTLGSAGKMEHLLLSEAELKAQGIEVLRVDRGGDITYHGPGQLVGYPIIQLQRSIDGLHADVVQYIRKLEESLILALADFGIQGERLEGYTGVWVQEAGDWAKIAAIGVKVSARAVTQHGFALNIDPDLRYFRGIIPCGIPDKPVSSMAALLGAAPDFAEVSTAVLRAFGQVFGLLLSDS